MLIDLFHCEGLKFPPFPRFLRGPPCYLTSKRWVWRRCLCQLSSRDLHGRTTKTANEKTVGFISKYVCSSTFIKIYIIILFIYFIYLYIEEFMKWLVSSGVYIKTYLYIVNGVSKGFKPTTRRYFDRQQVNPKMMIQDFSEARRLLKRGLLYETLLRFITETAPEKLTLQ